MTLRNEGSVAGLLLRTEVIVAEAPKEDDHAREAPGVG
jgi:chaperonin GroEL (HSP60 family)